MLIKEFDKETEKILDERIVERRKIERECIEANIADRDQRRIDKQELEDKGWGGFVIGHPSEPIIEEPIEDLVTEDKKKFIEKVKVAIKKKEPIEIIEELPQATYEDYKLNGKVEGEGTPHIEIPMEWTDTSAPIPDATIEPTIPYEELEPTITDIIEDRENIAESLRNTADEINNETKTIKDLNPEWIEDYKTETGKNAIWRGSITKGFKEYMKEIYDIDL